MDRIDRNSRGGVMNEEDSEVNSNRNEASRTVRQKDPSLFLQDYLISSETPEEVLFKINEILFREKSESTRKYDRAPLSLPVVFEYSGSRYRCSSYTLSQMGMFVKCADPPPPKSSIKMEIGFPDGDGELWLWGEVVYSKSLEEAKEDASLSGMSVVFSNVSQKDRRRIQRLVKAWLRKSGKVGLK